MQFKVKPIRPPLKPKPQPARVPLPPYLYTDAKATTGCRVTIARSRP